MTITSIEPSIDFTPPTPANESTITVNHTTINASIVTSDLTYFAFNWNGTNTTYLNNNSAIGDSSTVAVDISQYGNNGSFVNGSTGNWTTGGKWNGAMDFDGLNDYVTCGDDTSLQINANSSVSSWINFSGGVGLETITANCAADGYNGFYFAVYQGDLRMQYSDWAGYYIRAQTTDTIPSGWVHVAGTYDGNEIELYINGIQQSLAIDETGSGAYTIADTLGIGARAGGSQSFFNGSVDEVRIYNRLLSNDEINQSYHSNLWKFNQTQWYFETTQTALPDGTHNYQAFANNISSDYMLLTVDTTPPASITNLANTTGNFWHNWTWTNPADADFNYTTVYINGAWTANTSNEYYNLSADAHNQSTISTHTVDAAGNINSTWVNLTSIIPNNPVTWSGDAGANVYVDYDATDADSDTPTFSCNRTDLFTDFDTATGQGNWTATLNTYYVDFGVSDGYGSTSNYTMVLTASGVSITLYSSSPATIPTNYTGAVSVSYIVESTNPLNLSSLTFLYGINYTITGDMHAYVVAPSNTIAADGIYRAPNRNTTPYLSWEDNATITEGNVWQWAGGDNGSGWITKTPINATHTWINITSDQDPIFASSFYLDQLSMYSAPKTGIEINKAQGVIIKTYDLEQFRNRNNDYWINLYFDTDVEATPDSNIGIWYCNDSFDPTTDDPIDFCDYKASWTSDRWMNHSWTPHQNASYARPLTLSADIPACSCPPTDYNYIYLTSETVSSKSYILNATNSDPGICNLTFAQTETMWTRDETAGVNSPIAYTPSFFQTFVRDDEEYLHHLYIADVNGTWAHSGINNITIGVSHYPVAAPSFEYFNITCTTFGYTHDSMMDSTYDGGHFHIGVYCHADPDGGTVSHNLTLHYANGTLAGIINDTFTTTTPGIVEINFATTPYYSTTEGYTLKCVSTDDEGESGTAWLGTFFTLAADGTQGYYTDGYLMFWGMNDIPTLYATIANDSLISYHSGDDIYTMHVPFFKSKCNDTFRFNETVHLESLNTEDVAYFKFTGETIFDGATILAWDTSADAAAPTTDAYRGYLLSHGRVTGNITNSDLSNLGSDVYRQEGVNFVDNTMDYLIYNTTFSHNSRGLIM
jgi:hypothetical protein